MQRRKIYKIPNSLFDFGKLTSTKYIFTKDKNFMSANLSKNTVATVVHAQQAQQISFLHEETPASSSTENTLQTKTPNVPASTKSRRPKKQAKAMEPIKTQAITSAAPLLLNDPRIAKLAQLLPASPASDHLALSLAMRLSEIGRRHCGDLGDLKPKQIAALLHWHDENFGPKELLVALRASGLFGQDGRVNIAPEHPTNRPTNVFGKALREARSEANMTISRLAGRVGVSVSYLSDVERGNRGPLDDELLRMVCSEIGADYDEMRDLADRSRTCFILRNRPECPSSARLGSFLMRMWESWGEEEFVSQSQPTHKQPQA